MAGTASARIGVSNVAVVINGQSVLVVPNSVDIVLGLGTTSVVNETPGGSTTSLVIAQDLASAIGELNFKVRSTAQNILQMTAFKALLGGLSVELLGNTGVIVGSCLFGSIVNDPKFMFGVDAEVEINIKGTTWLLS